MSNDDEAGPSGHSQQGLLSELESIYVDELTEKDIAATRAEAREYINRCIGAMIEDNEAVLEDLKERFGDAIDEEMDQEDELDAFIAQGSDEMDNGGDDDGEEEDQDGDGGDADESGGGGD